MKKQLAIVLMTIVLLQSFSRIWIVTAFYINQEYIAANLCVNRFEAVATCKGLCALETKLEADLKQEQQQGQYKFQEATVLLTVNSFFLSATSFPTYAKQAFTPVYTLTFPLGYLKSIFRPPLVIS